MLVDFGSNHGWWIKAEVEDNHAFFTKAMMSNWQEFLADIWRLHPLQPSLTIDEFKNIWEIDDLKELHYHQSGDLAPFSIIDNEYVSKKSS